MTQCLSDLSGADIEALSSVIAEVNMLRANGTEQSSIATEDALRYLRAAKYNSSRAIEIYKNYQKNRELYSLDEIKPYREPLNSEIASGKIQILGTSDNEDAPILLFTGSKHDSKYSKMDAAMQLLFHTLDQIASNDSAQSKGIVFILDLRECSQDPKYLRNFISVLLNGYPLLLKMVFVVGSPMWVRPILMTFRQLHKIKFLSVPELLQHFSDHQLPTSLGGKFHPHTEPPPTSPGHAPPRPKLPRQQSQPEELCNIKPTGGERSAEKVRNPFPDHRGRSHSGSAADRPHLRPLHPILPPGHKSEGSPRRLSPPLPSTTSDLSLHDPRPQGAESGNLFCVSANFQKLRDRFQGKTSAKEESPIKPPHVVTGGGASNKTTPTGFAQQTSEVLDERPLPQSKATPISPLPGKLGGTAVASRIRNFEQTTESGRVGGVAFGNSRTENMDNNVGGAQRRGRGGRSAQALVAVQIGEESEREIEKEREKERERGREREREREKEKERERGRERERERGKEREEESARRRREEEMRRLRREEDRLQRERRAAAEKTTATKRTVEDDYENVDLGPSKAAAAVSRLAESRQKKKVTATEYENVPRHYTKKGKGQRSPEPSKASHFSNGPQTKETRSHGNTRVGAVSSTAGVVSPKRHQYENITILTESGPIPYFSSDEEEAEDDFSGDESPAPQEVIYENFGTDGGNQQMTAEEMERHLATRELKGLSAEYLRIKNEPLIHPYIACKLPCNISKNRYKDVVCYDTTRVVMETLPGEEGSDYIHANYVSSYKKPKTYILTQGPTKKTLVDFWRMVWEQQVHVIVMITKCVELGRHKCTQYWPDEGVIKYGNVTVTVSRLQQCEGYELRTVNISCFGKERVIKHFQFLAWPDYGVPTSGQAVLNLISTVKETAQSTTNTKSAKSSHVADQRIIVHCSAGVGRSGAFCVISNCIEEFRERGMVNVQGAVRALRLQRAYAIQTDEQYEFCYRTVLQYMKSHRN